MKKLLLLISLSLWACTTPNGSNEAAQNSENNTAVKVDAGVDVNTDLNSDVNADASSEFSLETAKAALACMQAAGDTSFSGGLAGQIELQEKLPSANTLAAMQTQIGLYNEANDPDC